MTELTENTDHLCQCIKCGRIHRPLKAGRPPWHDPTGIRLRKDGEHTVVDAEIGGEWIEVIRERSDGEFCHIVEPSGIYSRYYAMHDSQ